MQAKRYLHGSVGLSTEHEVQRMMGHRHITTAERYLHYAPDPDAAAKLWQSDEPGENVVSIRTAAA